MADLSYLETIHIAVELGMIRLREMALELELEAVRRALESDGASDGAGEPTLMEAHRAPPGEGPAA